MRKLKGLQLVRPALVPRACPSCFPAFPGGELVRRACVAVAAPQLALARRLCTAPLVRGPRARPRRHIAHPTAATTAATDVAETNSIWTLFLPRLWESCPPGRALVAPRAQGSSSILFPPFAHRISSHVYAGDMLGLRPTRLHISPQDRTGEARLPRAGKPQRNALHDSRDRDTTFGGIGTTTAVNGLLGVASRGCVGGRPSLLGIGARYVLGLVGLEALHCRRAVQGCTGGRASRSGPLPPRAASRAPRSLCLPGRHPSPRGCGACGVADRRRRRG